jgi:putative FmdB family regulatory protein
MPLYEYECDACGRRFEVIQRFSDRPAEQCSLCGSGPVRKLLSSPAIQFKGSGWYITDYARKDQKGAAKGDQKEASASGDGATAKDKPAKEKSSGGESAAAGGTTEKRAPAASADKE